MIKMETENKWKIIYRTARNGSLIALSEISDIYLKSFTEVAFYLCLGTGKKKLKNF